MAHLNIINSKELIGCGSKGGCGECQVSCQSAVKTSSAVSNQKCENEKSITDNE